MTARDGGGVRPSSDPPLLETRELLQRAKDGDPIALDQLMSRYLPRLRRWAAGRLPMHARSLLDTADLVQDTLLRVIQGLERVEVRGPGGFQAYVRQAVLNRIRDEVRWAERRPGPDGVPETLPDPQPTPFENAVGAELIAKYEAGMARLEEGDRRLLHLRIELGFDYDEIAAITGREKRNTARMAVQRALTRLADAMSLDD